MYYNNASVLPTSTYQGTQYYYFAIEKNGKLSTFGGVKEKADQDHPQLTAAREMSEESNGVFGSKKVIQETLRDWKKNGTVRITNPKLNHICYIAHFHLSNNPMREFDLIGKNKEIKGIIAVKRSTLQQAIDSNNWVLQGHTIRHCVQSTLKEARKSKNI